MYRTVFALLLLQGLWSVNTARAEYWIDVGEYMLYEREIVRYDSGDDIVSSRVEIFMWGNGDGQDHVVIQCRSSTMLVVDPRQWVVVPEDFRPLQDALCALRGSVPEVDYEP